MPRPKFANDQQRFEYILLKIAEGGHKDTPSNAKVRLLAALEWAHQKGIKTVRVNKDDFIEGTGIAPSPPEPSAPVEEKPVRNFLEEIEGLK